MLCRLWWLKLLGLFSGWLLIVMLLLVVLFCIMLCMLGRVRLLSVIEWVCSGLSSLVLGLWWVRFICRLGVVLLWVLSI